MATDASRSRRDTSDDLRIDPQREDGFVGLALNNALLFVDLEVFPQTDLFLLRSLPALIGLLLLIYGLIWDTQ